MGPRHIEDDTSCNVTPEADRLEAQMFVLHWAHTYVSSVPIRIDVECCIVSPAFNVFVRFLDMLMSKALGEPNTEPKDFTSIFEVNIL